MWVFNIKHLDITGLYAWYLVLRLKKLKKIWTYKKIIQTVFFSARMICRLSDFENGHNSLRNGRNDLALLIRSVFWVVLGGSALFTFLIRWSIFSEKSFSQFLGVSKNFNSTCLKVDKKLIGGQNFFKTFLNRTQDQYTKSKIAKKNF